MASESISYDATLLYASGIELYDNGRKSEALEKFREALALSPDFERAKQMINRLSPA